jgi:hypothetical protein
MTYHVPDNDDRFDAAPDEDDICVHCNTDPCVCLRQQEELDYDDDLDLKVVEDALAVAEGRSRE